MKRPVEGLGTSVALIAALWWSAPSVPVQAQETLIIPSAVVSTTATSNRERLAAGDEEAALFATFVGTLGAEIEGQRASAGFEYRMTLNQPLATFGNDQDVVSTELEQDHNLSLSIPIRLTERTTLTLSAGAFIGLETLRLLIADPGLAGVEGVGDSLDAPQAPQLLTTRNQIFSSDLSAKLKIAVTERDEASMLAAFGWRRDFPPKVLEGQSELLGLEGLEEEGRDTFSNRLALGWGHRFEPNLTGEVVAGTSTAVFETADNVSRTWFANVGLSKQFSPMVTGRITGGGAFTSSQEVNELGEIEAGDLLSATLGASLGVQYPTHLLAFGYSRGIVENGAVGNALLSDTVNTDLVWQYELDVLLRATGFGGMSRSALVVEGEENPATFTYGAGAAAIFALKDWLSLDVGYTFAGQFNPEVEDEALSQVSRAGFIKVHTVLVGLSARTYLSRGQRVFGESGIK